MKVSTALLFFLLAFPIAARDVLVSSLQSGEIRRYDAETGAEKGVLIAGLPQPAGLAFGPDRQLYVTLMNSGTILKINATTGELLGTFVFDHPDTPEDETGGSRGARSLVFAPDGKLYVPLGNGVNRIVRYDAHTGAFLDVFAQHPGMRGPSSLAFGPDGNLYVAAALSNAVYVFRGSDGVFLRQFTCGDSNRNLTGILFTDNGELLATATDAGTIQRYDPINGTCLGPFGSGGYEVPISVIYSADRASLLLVTLLSNQVLKLDPATGTRTGTLISSTAGLAQPHSIVLTPAPELPVINRRRRSIRH
jgi:DNA-binding beta-propeller fold protein YncE